MKRLSPLPAILFLLLSTSYLVLCPWTIRDAAASDYPDRPITIIVPYAPGGMIDTGARAFSEFLQKHLKQPVVVMNKTGGGQAVGGKAVVTAKPDGYTLGFFTFAAGNPEAYKYIREPSYSSEGLRPISRIMSPGICITVRSDAPYNSLRDLIKHAKENPGMKIGTQGPESTGWLLMNSVISKTEGTKFMNVPFRGGSEIVAALLGGHVPIGSPDYVVVKPLRDAKRLKPLAILTKKRPDFAQDVPTVAEQGYPFPPALDSAIGLFGPKNLPDAIVQKLDALSRQVTEDPEFQTVCSKMNMQIGYENSVTFTKTRKEHLDNTLALFEEQGAKKK